MVILVTLNMKVASSSRSESVCSFGTHGRMVALMKPEIQCLLLTLQAKGQWFRLSWESGCFQNKMSAFQIQLLGFYNENVWLLIVEKTKKTKEAENGPLKNSSCSQLDGLGSTGLALQFKKSLQNYQNQLPHEGNTDTDRDSNCGFRNKNTFPYLSAGHV